MKVSTILPFRQLRRLQGYDSDKQVAEKAGISRAMLSMALSGQCKLSDHNIERLAEVLKSSPTEVAAAVTAEVALIRQTRQAL